MSGGRSEVVICAVAIGWAIGGCRGASTSTHSAAAPRISRGDRVVVERAAAEFFEATVLSVEPTRLRVQTATDGEPVYVAASDAYRLPPEHHAFEKHELAICRDGPSSWTACRVEGTEPGAFAVTLGAGDRRTVLESEILPPNEVTRLNVGRVFERDEIERRFVAAAARAGEPRRPAGWAPTQREPVVARRDGGWYSARFFSPAEDGGVLVAWEGADRPRVVSADRIVPVPPFEHTFVKGEFALCRPATESEPWEAVRVESVGAEDVSVVGRDGVQRQIGLRQLVPLSRNDGE